MYAFSDAELLRILAAAKRANDKHWLMMCVAYNHGLRVSELTGKRAFRVKDIEQGRIYIQREKRGDRCDHSLQENPNPLLNERQALLDYVANLPLNQPVFTYCRQWFWVLVKRYAKAAGVPLKRARTHSFRHTVGLKLIDKIGVSRLQRFLGHKNGAATLQYTKPKEEDATQAANSVLSS